MSAEYTKTRSPLAAGVERGPSPPLLPSAPRSPPPGNFAIPVVSAQISFPVEESRARHMVSGAPSTVREISVKSFPLETENELNPAVVSAVQSRLGPPLGQASASCDT